jgi:phosphoribosylaminoimidazole (AIR) synthetase
MNFVDPIEITRKVSVTTSAARYACDRRANAIDFAQVIDGIYEGVTTVELDNLAAETAAYKTTTHPDYAVLAARIAISNLHKETRKTFSQVIKELYDYSERIKR